MSIKTVQSQGDRANHDSENRGLTVGFFTPDAINDPPQGWRTPALWINTGE